MTNLEFVTLIGVSLALLGMYTDNQEALSTGIIALVVIVVGKEIIKEIRND